MIERVVYRGLIFTRDLNAKSRSDRTYFKRKKYIGEGKYKKEMLHRVVWSDHNGKIPCDCVIHHIDKDPTNNNPGNLECIQEHNHARTRHKSRGD